MRKTGEPRSSSIIMNETTLITGCTSGIGLHLAREFAKNAHPLVYSEGLAVELEDAGVTVTVLWPGPTHTDFFEKAGR